MYKEEKMHGRIFCMTEHAHFLVAVLDLGCAHLIGARLDELCGHWKLLRSIHKALRQPLERYHPTGLVAREGETLVWCPDPAFPGPAYRDNRWIAFTPVGDLVTPHGGSISICRM